MTLRFRTTIRGNREINRSTISAAPRPWSSFGASPSSRRSVIPRRPWEPLAPTPADGAIARNARQAADIARRGCLAVDPLRHQLRHHERGFITLFTQPGDDAFAVGDGPVLAHLPLSLDARDRNLDADDRANLHRDKIRRCVFDVPGRRAASFLGARQFADLLAQPGRIFDR